MQAKDLSNLQTAKSLVIVGAIIVTLSFQCMFTHVPEYIIIPVINYDDIRPQRIFQVSASDVFITSRYRCETLRDFTRIHEMLSEAPKRCKNETAN